MATWERGAAAAVVGLACYEIASRYMDASPSLEALYAATPDGGNVHAQLRGADLSVGGLALIVGISMYVLTKEWTVLGILLFSFGSLSVWHHIILNRPAIKKVD